jgi:hypothetical protein
METMLDAIPKNVKVFHTEKNRLWRLNPPLRKLG